MMTRRQFAIGGVALMATGPAALRASAGPDSYDAAVQKIFRHAPRFDMSSKDALIELVRYGTMAANSHNTQPWHFKLSDKSVRVSADLTRRCPAVDPTDHHVFASLGCAVENMVVAADAFGLRGNVSYSDADNSLNMSVDTTAPRQSPAFNAIPERQCTRAAFNGKQVPAVTLKQIEDFARSDNVDVMLLTADAQKAQLTEYVVAGNTAQMDDPAFVDELRAWIRFNEAEALAHRDGLSYRSTGSPASPRWLGKVLFNLMFRKGSENDKYREQIASSAGIAIFVCSEQTKAAWVEAGRSYQRFALLSTALGIRHAFINQPVEVPSIRRQLSSYLGINDKMPDLIVRFGYGKPTPRTLRRAVKDVLV